MAPTRKQKRTIVVVLTGLLAVATLIAAFTGQLTAIATNIKQLFAPGAEASSPIPPVPRSTPIHVASQTATEALRSSKDTKEQIETARRVAPTQVSGGTISAKGATQIRIGRQFTATPGANGQTRITYPESEPLDHNRIVLAEITTPPPHDGAIRAQIIDDRTILIHTLHSQGTPDWFPFSFLVLESAESK